MKNIIPFFTLAIVIIGCASSWLEIPDSGYNLNDPNRPLIMIDAAELEYPYLATKVSIEGENTVDLTIDEIGTVTNVLIVDRKFNYSAVLCSDGTTKSVKELFDEPLIRFYKNSKFSPAQTDGVPIASILQTAMKFALIK